MTGANQRLLLQFAGISCLISGLALSLVGGLYAMETVLDGKSWAGRQWLTLTVGVVNIIASIAILLLVRRHARSVSLEETMRAHRPVRVHSDRFCWLPVGSCLMALAAVAMALLSWSINVENLQPGLALVCLLLTIASLVSAIIGIVVFRRGPRRLAVTAWIGLALCTLPIAFWVLMIVILLSINAGHPF